MTRRTVLYIAIAFLVLASGCGPYHRLMLCDPTHCPTPVGPACGPCAPECAPGAPGCGPAVAGVRPWGGPVCGPCGRCYGRGVLGWLFSLFRPRGGWCDGGCGERYWGGWLSDPPDCCDPCDRCGNWIGAAGPMVGAAPVGPVLPAGAVPRAGTCPECQGLPVHTASQSATGNAVQGVPHVPAGPSAPVGPTARRGALPWAAGAQPGVVTDPTSPYAPRLISVTDRAVGPSMPQRAQQASPEPAEAPETRVAEKPQPAQGPLR